MPVPQKTQGPRRRPSNAALGCGIACLALVVLAVLAAILSAVHFTGSASMADPTCFVTNKASGHLWVTLRPDDQPVVELVGKLMEVLNELNQRQQSSDVPDSLRPLIERAQRGQQADPTYVKQFMPLRLVLGYEFRRDADDEEKSQIVGSADFAKFGRTVGLMGKAIGTKAQVDQHAGYTVYHQPDNSLCFTGSGVVFASDREMLLECLDKVAGGMEEELPRRLKELSEPLDPGASIHGSLTNHDGALRHLIQTMMKGDKKKSRESDFIQMMLGGLLLGVEGISMDGTFDTPERLTGHIYGFCRDDSTAELVAMALYELRDQVNEELSEYDAELSMRKTVEDGLLTMSFQIDGFQSFLVSKLREKSPGEDD